MKGQGHRGQRSSSRSKVCTLQVLRVVCGPFLPSPLANLYQTWWKGGGDPRTLFKWFIFERSRSLGLKVKVTRSNGICLYLGGPLVDLNQNWWKGEG